MAGWGPALRIARRTALRSPGRTVLIAALIGVPVLAASWLGVLQRSMYPHGEPRATHVIGTADAQLVVTPKRSVEINTDWVNDGSYQYSTTAGPGQQDEQRDAAKVDVLRLLPPGSTLAARTEATSSAALQTAGSTAQYPVVLIDQTAGLSRGTYRLDSGRLPKATGEVALTPALAKHLRMLEDGKLRPDATVTSADGTKYQAVGVARPLTDFTRRMVWAPPGSALAKPSPGGEARYVVDLPGNADISALQKSLAGHGIVLTPRAVIVDPPKEPAQGAGSAMVVILIIGFGVLEIVLLAGTAFAVGARRQTRTLGLVAAAGGTGSDVRRIVLAQGGVIGLLGTGGGVILAIALAMAAKPWWEGIAGQLVTEWQLPVVQLVVTAAIGGVAGLLAAVVPAHTAANRAPMEALTGRFGSPGSGVRLRKPAVVLVAAGVGSVALGTSWLAAQYAAYERELAAGKTEELPGLTPIEPITMIVLGIACAIAGLIWLLPNLIARVATIGRLLPLSARLALRDAARHRHRTGPAAAAIMMSVAATAAASFAAANSFAAEAEDYIPTGRDGDAIIWFAGDNTSTTTGTIPWSAALEQRVAGALPTKGVTRLGPVHPVGARTEKTGDFSWTESLVGFPKPGAQQQNAGLYALPLVAVDPGFIRSLDGNGPEIAAALTAGKIVVPRSEYDNGGVLRVGRWEDELSGAGKKVPVAVLVPTHPLAAFENSMLVSTETAKTLGTLGVQQSHLALTREPTDAELAAAARILGTENALKVERGYESPANTVLLIVLAAAGAVTLLGVAISVSLSAAEGRADLATLAAVGAKPRQRRNLAGAQAWVLGQLGCLLGVGIGALYGYTARVAFGSPYFAVPWREIGGIVVVIPLFAGLLAWLLTRSRLPMVGRID